MTELRTPGRVVFAHMRGRKSRSAQRFGVLQVTCFVIAACLVCPVFAIGQTFNLAPQRLDRQLSGTSDAQRNSAVRSEEETFNANPLDQSLPIFLPVATYDASGYPFSIAVGDVNGDGHPDLVTANDCESSTNCSDGGVTVLLGNGDGTFQAPVTYGSGAPGAFSVAIADLNGDGHLDLVAANGWFTPANGTAGVLLGNGDGTFQPAVSYGSGGYGATSIAIADVNGDGHPDLVVGNECQSSTNCNNGTVGVLLGNGDGTFQPAVNYSSGGVASLSVAIADVNGDGHPDLIVANECVMPDPSGQPCQVTQLGEVSVLLGNGDGTFQAPVSYSLDGYQAFGVAVADVNGDGHPDLVVAYGCQIESNCGNGGVDVLLGNGDGTFRAPVSYSAGGPAFSVAIADLNGDGYLDLAVATAWQCVGCDNSGVSVLLGNGDGTFQAALNYNSGGISGIAYPSVAIADLNGDGLSDLALVNECQNEACDNGVAGVLLHVGDIPTTTKVRSSSNPSAYAQPVTLTATVSSPSGTPAGPVVFYDGSNTLGTATLANGRGAISVSSLSVGSHVITALYEGSVKFNSSLSGRLTQVVTTATTTTSIGSSANPVSADKDVSYTAFVVSQYGATATGTITFQDNGAIVATVGLSENQATFTTKYKTAGVQLITATYSGDSNNLGSTSSIFQEDVGKPPYASRTTVATSGSPSIVGQPVTFTATVTSNDGAIPNGELVTFYDNSTAITIGTGTTAGGMAEVTTSSLPAGTRHIQAVYSGDTTFAKSSGTVIQVVNKYTTTIALASSLNPSNYGQPVTLMATVTSTGPSEPTGTVTFKNGTASLGSATLNGSAAVLTKTNLPVGTLSISAEYKGDPQNGESTSPVLTQTVNQAQITLTLSSSPNPSTTGESVRFTATLSSNGGLPRGSANPVAFTLGGTTLGIANPSSSGVATFLTTTLPMGSDQVTATYAGSADYSSASNSVTQTVN